MSVVAIFHLGQVDVFPHKDGTIINALSMLDAEGIPIAPEHASPYQAYLALYLWVMVDEGLI